MVKNINSILKEVLARVEPTKEESKQVKNLLKDFLEKLGKRIKSGKMMLYIQSISMIPRMQKIYYLHIHY